MGRGEKSSSCGKALCAVFACLHSLYCLANLVCLPQTAPLVPIATPKGGRCGSATFCRAKHWRQVERRLTSRSLFVLFTASHWFFALFVLGCCVQSVILLSATDIADFLLKPLIHFLFTPPIDYETDHGGRSSRRDPGHFPYQGVE